MTGDAAQGAWPHVSVNPRHPGATPFRDAVPAAPSPAAAASPAPAVSPPPPSPGGPATAGATGTWALRVLAAVVAWTVIAATTFWLAIGVAVTVEKYRRTHRPSPAEVVAAEQTGATLPGCDLTLRVREGDREVLHRAHTSGACRTRPKVGETVTVQLPDNHDDDDIVLAGEETSDRVTTLVAGGVVAFGPTVLLGLPALTYLVLRRRRSRSRAQRAPAVPAWVDGYCVEAKQ